MLKKIKDKVIIIVQYAIKAIELVLSVADYARKALVYLRKLLDILKSA